MFSNSVQSFFQLWFPKFKSSIHSIILYNLWKFLLSIFNGLEMMRSSVKGKKNIKIGLFSNSVQSFFQLWFLKCKCSIHSIILYNLWKFQLSIFNGLEMGRYSVKRSEKFQNWNVFQLCKVIFFNYDFRSANLQFVVLF